jgi:hypothetical protein
LCIMYINITRSKLIPLPLALPVAPSQLLILMTTPPHPRLYSQLPPPLFLWYVSWLASIYCI